MPDDEAGEDETSAREYDEQRAGAIRSRGTAQPAKAPDALASRKNESKRTESEPQGPTEAAIRVDEDVEQEEEGNASVEALEGEETENRRSQGPTAARANPDVM